MTITRVRTSFATHSSNNSMNLYLPKVLVILDTVSQVIINFLNIVKIKKIGKGSFGKVYKVKLPDGSKAAMKEINLEKFGEIGTPHPRTAPVLYLKPTKIFL